MNRTRIASLAILLAVALFLGINLLANTLFKNAKIDFTEEGLYTLSDGTKKVLGSLQEPVKLRFFFSDKLATGFPAVKSYANRIEGILEEYVSQSDGTLTLEVIDPEPFSEEEDLAVSLGLSGAPIDNTGSKVYMGLVATNTVDDTQRIPFFTFDREKFLEYDLTRMIYDLANPTRTKVGILSSIPMELPNIAGLMNPQQAEAAAPWAIIQQARQLFDVVTLDAENTSVPDDIDVLMVVHPNTFSDNLLYAIDQYVMRKGRALFFVDPDVSYGGGDADNRTSDITKLFDAWGIKMDNSKLVADRIAATAVPTQNEDDRTPLGHLTNLVIQSKDSFNQDDITSANLNTIHMVNAGTIDIEPDSGLTLHPLIQSSPRSMLIDARIVRYGADPRQLINNFRSDNVSYTLAARIEGPLKSAFDNAPTNEKKVQQPHSTETTGAASLIVVADTDLLRDQAWARTQRFLGYQMLIPHADNGSFVINALDNLGGSGELISLRTRGTGKRPFTVVDTLRKEAEERFLSKERELKNELQRTEEALSRLQRESGDGTNPLALSPEQARELERFRARKVAVRRELRGVQRELNKEIESLGSTVKFINIGLVPLTVAILAAILLFLRQRKRSGGR